MVSDMRAFFCHKYSCYRIDGVLAGLARKREKEERFFFTHTLRPL